MRRPLLALTLLAGALGLTLQQAATGSNTFTASSNVATHRSVAIQNVSVTPTRLKSMGHTITLGRITEVRTVFTGDLRARTIRGRYGDGLPVTCAVVGYSLLGLLGESGTTVTCPGFDENANRPRALTFLIS